MSKTQLQKKAEAAAKEAEAKNPQDLVDFAPGKISLKEWKQKPGNVEFWHSFLTTAQGQDFLQLVRSLNPAFDLLKESPDLHTGAHAQRETAPQHLSSILQHAKLIKLIEHDMVQPEATLDRSGLKAAGSSTVSAMVTKIPK